jgi:tetratricopeptide (TPR) repeat protein
LLLLDSPIRIVGHRIGGALAENRVTICLDGAKRIERDGEVVTWIYERKWEQLLVILAEAEGAPVFRRKLVSDLYQDRPKGSQRLAEITFELKANLQELGAPDDAVISDRHAVRLGPSLTVQRAVPVAVGPPTADSIGLDLAQIQAGPIEEFIRDLPRRLADRCVLEVEEAHSNLLGPQSQESLARLDTKYSSILAAIDWALDVAEWELTLRMTGAMWRYWLARDQSETGRTYLDKALLSPSKYKGTTWEARCLHGSGALAALAGDLDLAESRLSDALRTWRAAGDLDAEAQTRVSLGIVANRRGNYDAARQFQQAALSIAEALGAVHLQILVLRDLALNETAAGEFARAQKLFETRLVLCQATGDTLRVARTQSSLATLYQRKGELETARRLAETAMRSFELAGDNAGLAFSALALGCAHHEEGDLTGARALYEASLVSAKATGSMRRVGESLRYLAAVNEDEGDRDQAVALYHQAQGLLESAGDSRGVGIVRQALAELGAPIQE